MKKNILIIVLGLSLLFLLVADNKKISSENISKDKITPLTTVEDQYLWGLRSFHEDRIDAVSDSDLIIAGQNACSFLDEGYAVPNVIINLLYTEKSINQDYILANEITANAVFTMCKEFIPQINAINP